MTLLGKIRLAFSGALDFFRAKQNLPTKTWMDIWESMHDKSFVVAGAMKEDLIADLRKEVDDALDKGTSIELFRKNFDEIVAKHGWDYKGGQKWRTRIIFETNLNSAYQAGRYKQLQAVGERNPYWEYRHSDHVQDPRAEHVAWDGLVLHKDDPWWDLHYPPNGWGCQCRVFARSERQLKKLGKKVSKAPTVEWVNKTIGKRSDNPVDVLTPKGIDAGFAYTVGKSTWEDSNKGS